jgi:hypothetical protein
VTNENSMSGRFAITIDGVEHLLSDPLVKGRDLLEIAGRIPVDEHLLFYRQGDGLLEDINLAEEIDLRASGKEEFSSVKADRLFFLVVDGRRFPWGKDEISGAELRVLALVPAAKDIFFDPKGGRDDLVEDTESVTLKGKEVEHFYTADRSDEPRYVNVDLNGDKVRILAGDYTTETLKDALGVSADLDLDVVDKQGSFRTLQPGEAIRVIARMKFVSHVRQGGSS